jgi:hypothetical protein
MLDLQPMLRLLPHLSLEVLEQSQTPRRALWGSVLKLFETL